MTIGEDLFLHSVWSLLMLECLQESRDGIFERAYGLYLESIGYGLA